MSTKTRNRSKIVSEASAKANNVNNNRSSQDGPKGPRPTSTVTSLAPPMDSTLNENDSQPPPSVKKKDFLRIANHSRISRGLKPIKSSTTVYNRGRAKNKRSH